jgi:hypothetical protein
MVEHRLTAFTGMRSLQVEPAGRASPDRFVSEL